MTRRGRRSKAAVERRNIKRYRTKTPPPVIAYGFRDRKLNNNLDPWIRDIIPIESERYYGADWTKQRQLALERDGFMCQYEGCNETKNLHVHHIVPHRISEDNSLDNLITLCPKHHRIIESQTGKQLLDGTVDEAVR